MVTVSLQGCLNSDTPESIVVKPLVSTDKIVSVCLHSLTRVHCLWSCQRSSSWPFISRGNYWFVTRAFGVYSGMHIFIPHIEYCVLADNMYFNIIHLRPHDTSERDTKKIGIIWAYCWAHWLGTLAVCQSHGVSLVWKNCCMSTRNLNSSIFTFICQVMQLTL